MKKYLILLALIVSSLQCFGQPNTEVYVFDLNLENNEVVLSNPKNISTNDGYDNQPSFLNDNTILFASTRSDQTDIRLFDIEAGSTSSWITDTPTGSEYSPLKTPDENAVSSIRLDLDGLQRLYTYDIKNGSSKLLLENQKVGYHVWYSKDILVTTVLVDDRMDLVVNNVKDKTSRTVRKNVGRCLSKIPNTHLVSFISKEEESWQIKSLDPLTGVTKSIIRTYKKSEDVCWLNDGSILTGDGKSILRIHPKQDVQWVPIQYFKEDEINNITRIAVSENSKRLAFVAEESPAIIVQKQLDAYNARDIDAFMATYTKDIVLINFPNNVILKGQEKMKEGYASYFDTTPDLNCKIINRTVIGNKVIDEEYVTANHQNFSAVAIYEIENGKISKVTFIQ